ncbi:LysR family transcriptional regulator [Nonomuraea sp. NPDC004580]|uniref:LysR family transcriptional regulator n=1 Tax=Nonomuraea sp. NPDC004580 TaxID=3154552 RepID=UPI0033BD4A1B
MSDVEIRQLRYFIAVAEERNFTRAAERLLMTQPALSRAIRALEREVGAELLVRSPGDVGLTPAGRVLLAEARALVVLR